MKRLKNSKFLKSGFLPVIILILSYLSGQSQDLKHLRYFLQKDSSYENELPYGNNPAAGHYQKVEDANIYYEIYGQGRPLVILHGGIVGSTFEMARFIDSLSKDYQVIAVSTRGHGKSEAGKEIPSYERKAKDVNAILETVTKDSAIILGFSDGAYTGFYTAKMFPGKVRKLIAIGAGEWKKGFRNFNFTSEVLNNLDSTYWKQQLALTPDHSKANDALIKAGSYYSSLEINKDIFSNVHCPVLLLSGEHDQNAPLKTVIAAYEMLPHAQLSIIPDAPHPAFQTNFPAVWAAIEPFIDAKAAITVHPKFNYMPSVQTTEEVLNHHLTAFGNNNLDELLKDYTEDSEVLTPNGMIKGTPALRKFFGDFFRTIPRGGATFIMKEQLIAGSVAYIVWSCETNELKIPLGTDTFIMEGDKIRFHTVTDYRVKK